MAKISRTEWAKLHTYCWVCGWRPGDPGFRRLETHEIPRGPHRAKAIREPAAWVRVCSECHETGLGTITEQLAMKKLNDERNYDRVAVNILRGRQPEAITEDEVDQAVEVLR